MSALSEAWETAILAKAAISGGERCAVLELARDGHPNARAYIESEIASMNGCPCGAEEYCNGVDRSGRDEYQKALVALLAEMDKCPGGET